MALRRGLRAPAALWDALAALAAADKGWRQTAAEICPWPGDRAGCQARGWINGGAGGASALMGPLAGRAPPWGGGLAREVEICTRSVHTTPRQGGGIDGRAQDDKTAVERLVSASVLPYIHLMRWHKPAATWLLAWPGFWAIALAGDCGSLPDLHLLALFGIGSVLLRGAGCTINDIWDQDLDKLVERTKMRPLAARALTSPQAIGLLGGQLLAGLVVLMQLNTYSQVLGVTSLALVGTYPLAKRITDWPQAYLGATINWGALMGWSAVHGSCDWAVVLPLYGACISWTMVYDTIYACQDKRDDIQAGVKSTALLFQDNVKYWLSGFAALSIGGLGTCGTVAGCGWPYYLGVAGAATHLAWQIGTVNVNNGPDCMAKFTSNRWLGAIFFSGIVADKLMCGS